MLRHLNVGHYADHEELARMFIRNVVRAIELVTRRLYSLLKGSFFLTGQRPFMVKSREIGLEFVAVPRRLYIFYLNIN